MLLLLTIVGISVTGQDIAPIPMDSNSQWRVVRGYNDGTCANMYNAMYFVDGTITENGHEYYTIYESGEFYQQVINPPGPCNETYFYENEYLAAIRSENGKTYLWTGWEEVLLMDFTLDVGDTMTSYICPSLVVTSVDSVLVGDEYRKRINFSNMGEEIWMVEGVGHNGGLIEPMTLILEFASWFVCYGEDYEFLYGDSTCMLNVGIEDGLVFKKQVHVYPNPTSGDVTIDFAGNQISSISLMNMYGDVLYKQVFEGVNSQQLKLDLSAFKAGVYFLVVITQEKERIIERIIKSGL